MDCFPSSRRSLRTGVILGKTADYERGHAHFRLGMQLAGYTVKPRETRETGGTGGTGERDKQDVRDRRDTKFEVPKTSNFGPRTLPRLTSRAFPASLARRA